MIHLRKNNEKKITSLISIFRSHKFREYIYGNNMEYQITEKIPGWAVNSLQAAYTQKIPLLG